MLARKRGYDSLAFIRQNVSAFQVFVARDIFLKLFILLFELCKLLLDHAKHLPNAFLHKQTVFRAEEEIDVEVKFIGKEPDLLQRDASLRTSDLGDGACVVADDATDAFVTGWFDTLLAVFVTDHVYRFEKSFVNIREYILS